MLRRNNHTVIVHAHMHAHPHTPTLSEPLAGNYTTQEMRVKTRPEMAAMDVTPRTTLPAPAMTPWFNSFPEEGVVEVGADTPV